MANDVAHDLEIAVRELNVESRPKEREEGPLHDRGRPAGPVDHHRVPERDQRLADGHERPPARVLEHEGLPERKHLPVDPECGPLRLVLDRKVLAEVEEPLAHPEPARPGSSIVAAHTRTMTAAGEKGGGRPRTETGVVAVAERPIQHRARQAWQSPGASPPGCIAQPGSAQSSRPRLRPTARTSASASPSGDTVRTSTPPHPPARPSPSRVAAVTPTSRSRQPHPHVAAIAVRSGSTAKRSGPSRAAAGARTGSVTRTTRPNAWARRAARASSAGRGGSWSTGTRRIDGDTVVSGSTPLHVAFRIERRGVPGGPGLAEGNLPQNKYETDKSHEIPFPYSTAYRIGTVPVPGPALVVRKRCNEEGSTSAGPDGL